MRVVNVTGVWTSASAALSASVAVVLAALSQTPPVQQTVLLCGIAIGCVGIGLLVSLVWSRPAGYSDSILAVREQLSDDDRVFRSVFAPGYRGAGLDQSLSELSISVMERSEDARQVIFAAGDPKSERAAFDFYRAWAALVADSIPRSRRTNSQN